MPAVVARGAGDMRVVERPAAGVGDVAVSGGHGGFGAVVAYGVVDLRVVERPIPGPGPGEAAMSVRCGGFRVVI